MTRQKKMCWKEYYSYDTVCRSLINPLNCARGRHFSDCLIIYNLSLSSSRNSDGFFTLSHCVSSILSLFLFSLCSAACAIPQLGWTKTTWVVSLIHHRRRLRAAAQHPHHRPHPRRPRIPLTGMRWSAVRKSQRRRARTRANWAAALTPLTCRKSYIRLRNGRSHRANARNA